MEIQHTNLYLKVKDYSVSKEDFTLYQDTSLDMLSTHPQPENLSRYYESEDYISHTDSKRSLMERLYHLIKGVALRNKLNLINSIQTQKGTLLDIGAGTGDFLSVAKQNGWNVTGIEPNEKAKAISISKGVSFVANSEGLADQSIDVITMWHVLEHVPDLEKQIDELKRILRPDGVVIIAVPNFKSFDASYYGQFWAAFDVPRHLWHFSKTSIKTLFSAKGLELQQIIPMKFDTFYVSLLSEKYKTGKMSYVKAFFVGLKSNRKAIKSQEYSSHIYILRNAK